MRQAVTESAARERKSAPTSRRSSGGTRWRSTATSPSRARVYPYFVPYTVALKDGRVLVGTVRAEGASAIKVTDTEAKAIVVPRADVEDVRPSATSIMPVGLAGAIGEARLRDLVAFLTSPGPASGIKGSGP